MVPISFLNDSETQDFRELKSKKFPKGEHAADPPRSLRLCTCLGNRSVFILDLSDKVQIK